MSTIRCRIPLGYFYGHLLILPEEVPSDLADNTQTLACTDLEKQLNILSKLFEDISCRYSLACSKLKELLHPFLVADMKNAVHLATYMNILKDRNLNFNNSENNKIFSAYQVIFMPLNIFYSATKNMNLFIKRETAYFVHNMSSVCLYPSF